MEQTKRHPLECITNQSGLSMLECLIPFVDYPLKLPLALFIKFNEIRMIMILNTILAMNQTSMSGNPFMNTNFSNDFFSNPTHSPPPDMNGFDQSISDIFAQYDMEQAAIYSEQNHEL